MRAMLSHSAFFEESPIEHRKPFDVGRNGVEITEAPPHHRSCSSGPDNGALQWLRSIRNAKLSHGSSDEVGQLFDWNAKGQPRFIHLLGHGASGIFEVGDGQTAITTKGTLQYYNALYWFDRMQRISKWDPNGQPRIPADDVEWSGGLMLEGCGVGDGYIGVRFLKELADCTRREVFAFTGLISVSRTTVTFEKGRAWIRQRPFANTQQVEIQYLHESLVRNTNLEMTGIGEEREPADIASVEVTSLLEGKSKEQSGSSSIELINQLFYSKSFTPEGLPLGILTHRIHINYKNREPLNVEVYAGRFASVAEDLAFIVGPKFEDTVAKHLEA
ncbi:hypothetical protein [Luteolibacter soli]|uniref:DUF4347 domain-containing protein n=1 Tax=Luteolibacter soli TaxID=3135280 RepID=A0ABU9B2G7_9BACT